MNIVKLLENMCPDFLSTDIEVGLSLCFPKKEEKENVKSGKTKLNSNFQKETSFYLIRTL